MRILNFSETEYKERLRNVKARMQPLGVDVLVVTEPNNIYYLSGYDAWSFYTPQALLVFLDKDANVCEIAMVRPRFGFQRIHVMLRREGWVVNHKRVHRLYRLEGLQLRRRVRRRKHQCLHRGIVPKATTRHERLNMDFVHDEFSDGRRFRILTVIDQWSREALIVEPRSGYAGVAVAELLERWVAMHDVPRSITVDHGTEFTSRALEDWRQYYNQNRPHSSLRYLTPEEYVQNHNNGQSIAMNFQV